ncbi:MAG: hypothetical protein OJF47_003382 [Nitrospira sp.]|nr:MAG: hypothetical protein OJF47_003382 [Nitrospira sp.]
MLNVIDPSTHNNPTPIVLLLLSIVQSQGQGGSRQSWCSPWRDA